MPYFVYKITAGPTELIKNLDQLDEFENFKAAKTFAKAYRQENDILPGGDVEVKIIFADNALDAEEKLLEKREKPILMEWEK